MTLIKWKPTFPAFSDMFDDFFRDDDFHMKWPMRVMTLPAVNVKETEKAFMLEVAAPGFTKKDLIVNVDNGLLTISAEKKKEVSEEEEDFTRREFSYETFKRTFTLPENVNADAIVANYKEGILHLKLPKVKVAKKEPGKVIEIA